MSQESKQIDESLYSRQLYVLGREAMRSMSQSRILISGYTNGLAVEIAKNVILGGVKSVTLHCDTEEFNDMVTSEDNYYGSATDIVSKLSELNPYVKVDVFNDDILCAELLAEYDVVVTTQTSVNNQLLLNTMARGQNTKFISASTFGLAGSVFCDFGSDFTVHDPDGEQPKSCLIESVTKGETTVITCPDSNPHSFSVGDFVQLTEVGGFDSDAFGTDPIRISCIPDRTTLDLEFDSSSLVGEYTVGGTVSQIKVAETVEFKSLEEALKDPEILVTDLTNFERPRTLHACFLGLSDMVRQDEEYPAVWNEDAANQFLENFVRSNFEGEGLDEDTVRKFSYTAQGTVCPVQSVIGGIVAQEVMKACSGKFTPIKQFMYFESFDSLGTETPTAFTQSHSTTNTFGDDLLTKIQNQKWFVVGAGAIGCELLKNMAMMDLATGSNGQLTVTDMDTIERSNLNRQFLFRPSDIGKAKSEAASDAILTMNPRINIESRLDKVGPDTEDIYNTEFFNNLDGVANALDNKEARLYVDSRCVLHGKPLLESGTLGTKGNVQVVIPHLTESYGSSTDPPEESIPLCTLKHFPNKIDHTIQYARDQFEGFFNKAPQNAFKFLEKPSFVEELGSTDKNEVIEDINNVLVHNRPETGLYLNCVMIGYQVWHREYNHQIRQLLTNFPPDHRTSSGALFWSGAKKQPTPLTFSVKEAEHVNYVLSYANLLSYVYNIEIETDKIRVMEFLSSLSPPPFTPKTDVRIAENDEEEKERLEEEKEGQEDTTLLPYVHNLVGTGFTVRSIEFEKDDDTNYHMDFITAASNLRAMNYGIKPVDRHTTKGIAGKIIPAIATTTAIVAGLVCLELYKTVQGHRNLEKYRNSFLNLGIPMFCYSEPMSAAKMTYNSKETTTEFTLWDHIDAHGDETVEDLLDRLEDDQGLEVDMVTHSCKMLYSYFQPMKKQNKRKSMTIRECIQAVLGQEEVPDVVCLSISCDEEEDLPQIKVVM